MFIRILFPLVSLLLVVFTNIGFYINEYEPLIDKLQLGELKAPPELTLKQAHYIDGLYSLIHSADIHHAEVDEAQYDYLGIVSWH